MGINFIDGKTMLATNHFYVGMDLIIDVSLLSKNFNTNTNFELSLGISDQFGNRITLVSNKISGYKINPNESGNWIQRIFIKKLPLSLGKYSITTFVASNGNIHDWIIDAMSITIESDSYFGELVHTLPNRQGNFYLDFKYL
jgi:hypothetical protein